MSCSKKICADSLRYENEIIEPELVKKLHKAFLTEAKECAQLISKDERMESLNKKKKE